MACFDYFNGHPNDMVKVSVDVCYGFHSAKFNPTFGPVVCSATVDH